MKRRGNTGLIDVWDRAAVDARRPLLIAHRGGVLGPNAPENSLGAITLAAAHRYDMVELDVREAKDGEPILFHDRDLWRNCGIRDVPEHFPSDELARMRYRGSDEHIPTLADALALCRKLGIGVMFDVKAPAGREYSPGFFDRVNALVDEHRLIRSCVTISDDPVVREALHERALLAVYRAEAERALRGEEFDLAGAFWFGMRDDLPEGAIAPLKARGALVIAAMNTFRYPAHAYMELARRDVAWFVAAGADGYQIDSVYGGFFTLDGGIPA